MASEICMRLFAVISLCRWFISSACSLCLSHSVSVLHYSHLPWLVSAFLSLSLSISLRHSFLSRDPQTKFQTRTVSGSHQTDCLVGIRPFLRRFLSYVSFLIVACTLRILISGRATRSSVILFLLWTHAQRASMLYFADVFLKSFFYARLSWPNGWTDLHETFTRGRY